MVEMTTSEILDKAADEMMIRGWGRGVHSWMWGTPDDADRKVCIEGALMAAMNVHMVRIGDPADNLSDPPEGFNDCPAARSLKRFMREHLPQHELDQTGYHIMFEWNDHHCGTEERAIHLLRGAAKAEREREAAANAL